MSEWVLVFIRVDEPRNSPELPLEHLPFLLEKSVFDRVLGVDEELVYRLCLGFGAHLRVLGILEELPGVALSSLLDLLADLIEARLVSVTRGCPLVGLRDVLLLSSVMHFLPCLFEELLLFHRVLLLSLLLLLLELLLVLEVVDLATNGACLLEDASNMRGVLMLLRALKLNYVSENRRHDSNLLRLELLLVLLVVVLASPAPDTSSEVFEGKCELVLEFTCDVDHLVGGMDWAVLAFTALLLNVAGCFLGEMSPAISLGLFLPSSGFMINLVLLRLTFLVSRVLRAR